MCISNACIRAQHNRLRICYLLGLILFSTLTSLGPASCCFGQPQTETGKWCRFRGPNGSGISVANTVPTNWTDNDYNWIVRLPGEGHSSPVVWGERILVTCADLANNKRFIVCLDRHDGSCNWQRDFPAATYQQHHDNGYATATPAVDANGVVVTWTNPEQVVLLALDNKGGDVWRRNLGPFIGPHGSGASPIIVGDTVVLANEQEDYGVLYRLMGRPDPTGPAGTSFILAVDRNTGITKWKTSRQSTLAPYSTPCVYRRDDGGHDLILSSTSHGISAIDIATGKVRWQMDDLFSDRCVASPIAADGIVFASYGHGVSGKLLVAVRPGSSSKDTEPSVAYEVKHGVPLVPTPIVHQNRLYLWTDAGVVTCLECSTGRVIWRERASGSFFSSPVCTGDRLYCIAKNGDVVVLAASDEFKKLARVPLGEASFATPAIADGVMYLRTRTRLLSLGGTHDKH